MESLRLSFNAIAPIFILILLGYFLKRIKIGELTLTGLNRGEVRPLRPSEIDYLLNI